MDQTQKYYQEIKKKFDSGDEKVIVETIKDIKHTGNSSITPLILDLLRTSKEDSVIQETITIISQFKDPGTAAYVAVEIEKGGFGKQLAPLLTSCWQSGIDFSKHLEVFAKCFVKANFQEAFEAFTVIEEAVPDTDTEKCQECIHLLKENVSDIKEDIKPLYVELIKLLENR